MTILVTGHAGFIGFHTTLKLLELGYEVVGVDSLNNYYDVELKKNRLEYLNNISQKNKYKFHSIETDISNFDSLSKCFKNYDIKKIVNLAAQAGVRYSIENPQSYIDTNITGFLNILELSKKYLVEDVVYASTSSVYGGNSKIPSSESDNTDQPIQFYAVTKKTNELMAHAYGDLFNLRTTGLRFFTVYGPWGRPDMALFLFTDAIINKTPINLFNNGNHYRDFTYIDDIVKGIIKSLFRYENNIKEIYKIYNIGNGNPINLNEYILEIEKNLNISASKIYLPLQPGDVIGSRADTNKLNKELGYVPEVTIQKGVKKFITWYLDYFKIKI